jgi:hypothetical protein
MTSLRPRLGTFSWENLVARSASRLYLVTFSTTRLNSDVKRY